jgi:MraZ protein
VSWPFFFFLPAVIAKPRTRMFIGEYRHTLDSKNRISLPAKFRKELGGSVVVTRGLDRCLFIYPKGAWKKQMEKIAQHATGSAAGRGLSRLMLAGAVEADVDSAGRILVPDYLRTFAGLSAKGVVAGVNDRVELWDEAAWDTYTANIERDADQFAETLGERGVF